MLYFWPNFAIILGTFSPFQKDSPLPFLNNFHTQHDSKSPQRQVPFKTFLIIIILSLQNDFFQFSMFILYFMQYLAVYNIDQYISVF
jgi:hypothetical protein